MLTSLAGSRIALLLRRMNARFGIAAPQVAIRTYVPWYLRIASTGFIVVLLVVLTSWAYDAGSRMAGFEQSEAGELVKNLKETNASLEEETARLRSLLAASESSLQIERAAQQQLNEKNGLLVSENTRLKEEMTVFERLLSSKSNGATAAADVVIDKINVKAEGKGRYRFSFMIALQNARRGKDARFNLLLLVSPKAGGAGDKITLPRSTDSDLTQYEITVRNFRHIDGKFDLPPEFVIGSVEFRILESGSLKASRSISI